jgi:hypothetical protein
MWGSPESLQEIKALITLIERAQLAQLPASAFQKVTAPENAPTLVPSGSSNAPTERVPETANAE